MAKSAFEKQLDAVLGVVFESKAQTPYEESRGRLRLVCDRIEKHLSGGGKKVVVTLQPGFKANVGHQINVVVEVPQRQYRDTLFRAYIPDRGLPIALDFYGEQPVPVATHADMERTILNFLAQDETRMRLQAYMDLAAK